MCGRFTQQYSWKEVHDFLNLLGPPRNVRGRYNIAPTTDIDVIRKTKEGRELVSMRWGLVPGWWKKSLKDLPATFNARRDSVAIKPMYRSSYKSRRCIIPASGFYEWTGPRKERQPHYFTAGDGSPVLGFAGIWDSWRDPETGEEILSCTMIVTEATEWMKKYHDRMPGILMPQDFDAWLDGSLGAEDLKPASESALRQWEVSPRVNSVRTNDEDPTLIAPQDGDLVQRMG